MALGLCLAVSGCLSGPKGYLEYRTGSDPVTVMARMASNIEACWFEKRAGDFQGLIYAPERNSGASRILLVPKDNPGGLPQLIIEATQDKRSTSIKVFGPLLNTNLGPTLQTDVAAWSEGRAGCA